MQEFDSERIIEAREHKKAADIVDEANNISKRC